MAKKGLSDEDKAVWKQVTKTVEKSPSYSPQAEPQKLKKSEPKKSKPKKEAQAIKPFRVGEKAPASSKTATPHFTSPRSDVSPNMDRKTFQRLIKGKMEIEATLDLHGLTSDQAKLQCTQFIRQCHTRGMRMVLVITGKGNTYSVDEFNRPKGGVIKRSLPDWLTSSALSHLVLQVSQAQRKHGGEGAYYVYLRRSREG